MNAYSLTTKGAYFFIFISFHCVDAAFWQRFVRNTMRTNVTRLHQTIARMTHHSNNGEVSNKFCQYMQKISRIQKDLRSSGIPENAVYLLDFRRKHRDLLPYFPGQDRFIMDVLIDELRYTGYDESDLYSAIIMWDLGEKEEACASQEGPSLEDTQQDDKPELQDIMDRWQESYPQHGPRGNREN